MGLPKRNIGGRRQSDERGVAAVWTLIIASAVFIPLIGLVGGGGELVNEQVSARRAAEQAARAGADALSEASLRSGVDRVDAGTAIARANQMLTTAGWSGSVQVEGSRVIVTVDDIRSPPFLSFLGLGHTPVRETGIADAITSPDG